MYVCLVYYMQLHASRIRIELASSRDLKLGVYIAHMCARMPPLYIKSCCLCGVYIN